MRATDEEVLAKFPYVEEDGWPRANWIEQHRSRVKGIKHRLAKYKLTEEQFNFLFNDIQRKCCAICRKLLDKHACCIDHCHTSGNVRGILCVRCNNMLGFIEDDENPLDKLAKIRSYLEAHAT